MASCRTSKGRFTPCSSKNRAGSSDARLDPVHDLLARRDTADGRRVRLWTDGSITLAVPGDPYIAGLGMPRSTYGKKVRIAAVKLIVGDISLYDLDELPTAVRIAEKTFAHDWKTDDDQRIYVRRAVFAFAMNPDKIGSRTRNRAGEAPGSQDAFMGDFFRYADLRGRYVHFDGYNRFNHRYDTLHVSFVNLPVPRVEESRRPGADSAEVFNHRQTYVIRGFASGAPFDPAPGKVKIETMTAGRYPRLRTKTGTPAQIAQYLAVHLNGIVSG